MLIEREAVKTKGVIKLSIKNIIFDIGGVLADPKTGHWFITNHFFEIINKEFIQEKELKESLKRNLYLQTQEPKTEKQEHEMFSNYYEKVLKEIHYPNLTKELADKIADDCVYNDEKFIFYEDVQDNLKKLSSKYDLYIISNGWPSSLRVLKYHKLDHYFKGIMISSIYGTSKEDKLFDLFLKEYQVNPEESVFIDDRKHILKKAKEYDFNLILMDRKKTLNKEEFYKIDCLNEIENYIMRKE